MLWLRSGKAADSGNEPNAKSSGAFSVYKGNVMPKGYGSFLAVAALLCVQAVSAAPLDDNALRLYGGTYSAKCGDRGTNISECFQSP